MNVLNTGVVCIREKKKIFFNKRGEISELNKMMNVFDTGIV